MLTSLPAGISVNFNAWMPGMGHQLDDAGYFQEISQGMYLNQAIKFNMTDMWTMQLLLLDENLNTKDELEWSEIL